MNTDFRISVSATRNPKVLKLMRRCGDRAFYNLICLWTYVAQDKPNGILEGADADDIELAADWTGEPGAFYRTLVELRLLDVDEDGVVSIHDWSENNGYASFAQTRSDEARKAAHARWDKQRKTGGNVRRMDADECTHDARMDADECTHDARMDADECTHDARMDARMEKSDAGAYAPSPSPSPSPSPAPYSEKDFCAEPPQAATAAPKPDAHPVLPAEPVMVFPLAKRGETYPISREDIAEWQEAYPGIDVQQGLRNCLQWNRDNPTRRKTKTGIRKHISGWLAREQNQSHAPKRAAPLAAAANPPMTARQRYMHELGEMLIPDQTEENHDSRHDHDIIDITPPHEMAGAERTVGTPGRALP